ncbi:hypothetical protein [Paenibacillus sp. 2003]|nr:hypothetical protein [Paenibacillus sp. 2003]MDR6718652.1 hypothetical protein [Paenibacillus sp. 2003]
MSKPSSRENGSGQIIRIVQPDHSGRSNNSLPELLQVPLFLLLGQVYLIR